MSLGDFQVLARTATDHPWTWYPAVFLAPRVLWNKYAYVQIQLGPHFVEKFVSAEVVRWTCRDGVSRAVGPVDYVVRACTLPPEYATGLPIEPALWCLWQETMSKQVDTGHPLCVVYKSMLYLQDLSLTPVQKKDLKRINGLAKGKMARRLKAGWIYSEDQWIPPKIQYGNGVARYAAPVPPFNQRRAALVPELWREILTCFCTNERSVYRRVSPLWNAIIQHEESSQYLTLNFGNRGPVLRSVGICIVHCLTAATEMVVITCTEQRRTLNDLSDCLCLISALYQQLGYRPRRLQVMVYCCNWKVSNKYLVSEGEVLGLLTNTCANAAVAVERIFWRNCSFAGSGGEHTENTVLSDMTIVRGTMIAMPTAMCLNG
ncbi:uncharacterized protein LOC129586104 [Paramacrobiotus metropolitanus]|uniref:uncharacterized protein LOC129586104 n=1 Tax=Paramacrobiotus metropolitanus TaxID=2943436 RepID=UPI002445E9E7|nr:uncharacterized protein LOC129586104 [Paramacrobiotus metropolitanus]